MRCKRLFLSNLILFFFINSYSQKIVYEYDDNGNRVSRTLIVEQLQPGANLFPLSNPMPTEQATAGGNEQDYQESVISDEVLETSTYVYPNPNKGLLKIDISNLPINSKNEIRLYDLYGTELKIVKNFDSHIEIDISQFRDGIYILRIKINERLFDWKIIKST